VADPAKILLGAALLAATAAHGAELGTLFFTPAEREELDRMRRGEPAAVAVPNPGGAREITGYVKRSDGLSTVWIDGRPVVLADPKSGRLLDPRAVSAYARGADDVKVERKP
jgi:hypothetical protein